MCSTHYSRWWTAQCKAGTFKRSKMALPEGTRRTTPEGYIVVKVAPDHPMATMSNAGWILEHRLVMAELLGRPLVKGENVHHINGVHDDNSPDNLELWTRTQPNGTRVTDYHCPGCRCAF